MAHLEKGSVAAKRAMSLQAVQHYCAVAETLMLGNPNNKTVKNISAN
jgi:hypothetical protein